jgi:hypothetical protein
MRARSLDRRVRKEAVALVREARAALGLKRGLRGKAGDLESATAAVEQGLAAKDLAAVRAGLPALDALVDELIKRPAITSSSTSSSTACASRGRARSCSSCAGPSTAR